MSKELLSVTWKVHFRSPLEKVYSMLSTDEGRETFWAEKAIEKDGFIHFEFINGWTYKGRIIELIPYKKMVVDYFGSKATFLLYPSDDMGTDLTLINEGIPPAEYNDVHAGWVSVLMSMKAACDYDIDLRNHNTQKCWDNRYVEN